MVSVKEYRVNKMVLVLSELTVQPGETKRQCYKEGQVLGRGWHGEIRQWPQKGP